jgi:hypothetical protein
MLIEEIILADFPHFTLDWIKLVQPSQLEAQLHLTQSYAACLNLPVAS